MKPVFRFSVGMALAAILCFAPCAFGSSLTNLTGATIGLPHSTLSASLLVALAPGNNIRRNNIDSENNSNLCGDDWGWDGGGWSGNGGGCSSVPEGGSALAYLLIGGLCCAGALGLKLRTRALTQAVE
jgi:hypothetical protein